MFETVWGKFEKRLGESSKAMGLNDDQIELYTEFAKFIAEIFYKAGENEMLKIMIDDFVRRSKNG